MTLTEPAYVSAPLFKYKNFSKNSTSATQFKDSSNHSKKRSRFYHSSEILVYSFLINIRLSVLVPVTFIAYEVDLYLYAISTDFLQDGQREPDVFVLFLQSSWLGRPSMLKFRFYKFKKPIL